MREEEEDIASYFIKDVQLIDLHRYMPVHKRLHSVMINLDICLVTGDRMVRQPKPLTLNP